MGDRISRLDDYRDRLRDRVGPPEPDPPAPGSISERVRELTDGGTLRDPANRTPEVMFDPELRRRSRALLRQISQGDQTDQLPKGEA